tara:strand:+ start:934 stop:1188 length:255 start_codon:yes stop_codon:yes gene_type:complete
LDQAKTDSVIERFFSSLKTQEDKMLDTGLTHNTTVTLLQQATMHLIQQNPKRFEVYVKWFLNSAMYLLEEDDTLLEIKESDFIE